jgi:hypothetical protein
MSNLKITPFLVGKKHSVEIEDFEPKGGYEVFLKELCLHLGAVFVKWHQGVEIGVGEIIYKDCKMTLLWTDFPEYFSFDCDNKAMAVQLKKELEGYFYLHEEVIQQVEVLRKAGK